jgi:thiol-disulfide isomerase/thioredoxin
MSFRSSLFPNASDIYHKDMDVIELKVVRDMITGENDMGDIELRLVHDRFMQARQGLMLLYSPRCPHCVNMKDMYKNLAKQLKNKKFNIPTAAVNLDDAIAGNQILTEYLDVKQYPTVYWYNGEYTLYNGSNDLKSLLKFVCLQSGKCEDLLS